MFKLLLCLCFLFCSRTSPQTKVWTNVGYLQGKWSEGRSGQRYLAFYGIPYAKPPLGHLRFKDPIEYGRWRGTRDASHVKEGCMQPSGLYYENTTVGSEDCLYLNIYTPDTKYGTLLPVIVYFHGGSFERGNAVIERGPDFWMDERIVIVTVAYRLGAFGFLSFGDSTQPGNMGLKDQLLALKWIRQNIPAFGGHPKRLTIMGDEAGGVSVNLHIASPLSKGLYQAGISMSGTIYNSWSWLEPEVARDRAKLTAKLAGCLMNTTKETVDCLKKKSAVDIINLQQHLKRALKDPYILYGPVVDSYAKKGFIPEEPTSLPPSNIPWLIGYTSRDGLLKTKTYKMDPGFEWNYISENFLSYLQETQFFFSIPADESKVMDLRKYYFRDYSVDNKSFQNITQLFTDAGFFIPLLLAIKAHKGPTFAYEFDYIGEDYLCEDNQSPVEGKTQINQNAYLWNSTQLNGEDVYFSKSLVKLWTNFAKYGTPTTRDSVINWQRYDKSNKILYIQNTGYALERNRLDEKERFWERLLLQ